MAALTLALVLLYEAGGFLFLGLLGRPRLGLLVTGPLLVLFPLAGALHSARLPLRASLRLNPVRTGDVLLAVTAVVAAVPPVLAVLSRLVQTPPRVEEFFTGLLRAHSAADLVVVLLLVAVIPAWTEETLFRGFLQRGLERRLGRAAGIAMASVAFGIIHGPARAPSALALGLLLGWIASRTGSIVPSVAAHAVVNALAVSVVNAERGFGTGRSWPETLPAPALVLWAAISAAAIAALARRPRAGEPPADPPAGSDPSRLPGAARSPRRDPRA